MSAGAAEPVVYTLKWPVQVRTAAGDLVETVTELRLRRLKARDLRTLDSAKGGGSGVLALVACSAGLPPSTMDLLDAQDVLAAGEVVAGFLGGSLPTGAL